MKFDPIHVEGDARFKVLADFAPVLLWMSGLDGLCIFFNKTWLEFTGRSLEQEIGVGWAEGIHFEDFQNCMDTYIRAFNKREAFEMEYRLRRKDGQYRYILDRGQPRYTQNNLFAGYLGSCIDITERRNAIIELQEAHDLVVQHSRLKSEFLANISHEIRTPLNGIIGLTDLLLRTSLDPTQLRYVSTLQSSGNVLLALVNEVLDFSAVEAGKMKLDKSNFPIQKLVKDIVALLNPRAVSKGLSLSVSILPEVAKKYYSDAHRVRQILTNLIGNAIKFTESGSVKVSISIVESFLDQSRPRIENESLVRFEVSDSGPGIPEESMKELFKPFSQLDGSLARQQGGTGLGLAICKRIVDVLGGEIGVESKVGVGSKFWFTIPLRNAKPTATKPPQSKEQPVVRADAGWPLLVVEDNPVNQMVIQEQLKYLGYQVRLASDGYEAVKAITDQEKFSAILMDCQMPGMDGLETTQKIRDILITQNREIPIIATTAHAFKGERKKCLAAGMNEYLSKPVDLNRLSKILERYTK